MRVYQFQSRGSRCHLHHHQTVPSHPGLCFNPWVLDASMCTLSKSNVKQHRISFQAMDAGRRHGFPGGPIRRSISQCFNPREPSTDVHSLMNTRSQGVQCFNSGERDASAHTYITGITNSTWFDVPIQGELDTSPHTHDKSAANQAGTCFNPGGGRRRTHRVYYSE